MCKSTCACRSIFMTAGMYVRPASRESLESLEEIDHVADSQKKSTETYFYYVSAKSKLSSTVILGEG